MTAIWNPSALMWFCPTALVLHRLRIMVSTDVPQHRPSSLQVLFQASAGDRAREAITEARAQSAERTQSSTRPGQ